MKNRFIALVLASALVLAVTLSLSSCASEGGQEALTRAANVALAAGVISGRITPAQAAAVQKHGALILAAEDGPAKLAAIGLAALDVATETGKLTPEQAAALRAAGTVPLAPPVPDVAAPAAALPVVDVTSSK